MMWFTEDCYREVKNNKDKHNKRENIHLIISVKLSFLPLSLSDAKIHDKENSKSFYSCSWDRKGYSAQNPSAHIFNYENREKGTV